MRSLALLAFAALVACSEPPFFVDPPAIDGAKSEIFAVHRGGDVTVYAISRDDPFAIPIETRDPISIESLLYTESLAELGLEEGELPRATGRSRGLPVPTESFVQELHPDDGPQGWRLAENLSDALANYRIEGTCGILDPLLTPFAADAVAVRPADENDDEVRFRKIVMIEEDALFALTNHALYLIRRGEQFSARFRPNYTVRSFDFDRRNNRLWVAGETTLTELSFDRSAMTMTVTSTATGCNSPHVFEEVIVDELGRPIVATDRGGVCRLEQGVLVELPFMEFWFGGEDANLLNLIRTPDPAHPYLASSSARLHLFNTAGNYWEIGDGTRNLSPPFLPYALGSQIVGGELENWAGGTGGRVFRQQNLRGWVPWRIDYPPDYRVCGSGEYPAITDIDDVRAMFVSGERVLIAFEFCTAIVEIDLGGRCSMLATPGGLEALEGGTFDAIDAFGSAVVAGGTSGLLYSARRR